MDRSQEALIHLLHVFEYEQESLTLVGLTFAYLLNNIGLLFYRNEQYSYALKCFFISLDITSRSLLQTHVFFLVLCYLIWHLFIGVKKKFDEALYNIEKSTEQRLTTLSTNHSDVVENLIYAKLIRPKK